MKRSLMVTAKMAVHLENKELETKEGEDSRMK